MKFIVLGVVILAIAGIYFVGDLYSKIREIKFRFEEQIKLYEAQTQAKHKPTKKKKGGK